MYYQNLPYMPEIVKYKVISKHHDGLLIGHFGIKKTKELLAKKYF